MFILIFLFFPREEVNGGGSSGGGLDGCTSFIPALSVFTLFNIQLMFVKISADAVLIKEGDEDKTFQI